MTTVTAACTNYDPWPTRADPICLNCNSLRCPDRHKWYEYSDLDAMEDRYGEICAVCHLPADWHDPDAMYCNVSTTDADRMLKDHGLMIKNEKGARPW